MTVSTTRRRLLQGAGALTLVAVGGAIWRAHDREVFVTPSGTHYDPWEMWQSPDHAGTPLALVAAGILASNPHNTQPWIFRVSETEIEVLADTARDLGAFDPYLREMHIGLGCAIENMVLAAPANGLGASVEAAPGSLLDIERGGLVRAATIRLSSGGGASDPLYDAIPHRHTNRYGYDRARGFPEDLMRRIGTMPVEDGVAVSLFTEGDAFEALGQTIIEATDAIVADDEMIEDSHRWFRDGPQDMARERSGLALDTAGLSPALLAAAKFLPALPAKQSHGAWADQTRDTHVPTAALLGTISVRDRYDRPQALAAGRIWQRIHLEASAAGIAMHPLNQPVEMIDRDKQLGRNAEWEARLGEIIGDAAWQPTFAFRGGYPTKNAPASARRSVEQVTQAG
ncbi:MAG: hypothetical protein LPK88_10925 [Alphaproteobacteria bacterium]|nr:hypothetical protein [Alphaproteobacteria bacterium]MDX5416811.1 hypothetical protein [Alphaproteobacteria bacterium]MDX5494199.1 hypothetical protein [Alphaproteobacteria bacterium]